MRDTDHPLDSEQRQAGAHRVEVPYVLASDIVVFRPRAATLEAHSEDRGYDRAGDQHVGCASARRRTRRSTPRQQEQRDGADGDSWLNADQAAEHMALSSRKALYEIVRAGRVPYYRFGHSLRFRREELDAVIAAGRMRPAVYERRKKEIAVDGPSCADPGEGYDRVDARLQQEGGE